MEGQRPPPLSAAALNDISNALERTNVSDAQRESLGVGPNATIGDMLIRGGNISMSTIPVEGKTPMNGSPQENITGLPNFESVKTIESSKQAVKVNGQLYQTGIEMIANANAYIHIYDMNGNKLYSHEVLYGGNLQNKKIITGYDFIAWLASNNAYFIPKEEILSNSTPHQVYGGGQSITPTYKNSFNVYNYSGSPQVRFYDKIGNVVKTLSVENQKLAVLFENGNYACWNGNMVVSSWGTWQGVFAVANDTMYKVIGQGIFTTDGKLVTNIPTRFSEVVIGPYCTVFYYGSDSFSYIFNGAVCDSYANLYNIFSDDTMTASKSCYQMNGGPVLRFGYM